jgi:hypothetical protein
MEKNKISGGKCWEDVLIMGGENKQHKWLTWPTLRDWFVRNTFYEDIALILKEEGLRKE